MTSEAPPPQPASPSSPIAPTSNSPPPPRSPSPLPIPPSHSPSSSPPSASPPSSSPPSTSPPHSPPPSSSSIPPSGPEYEYWGTNVMGVPVPASACANYDLVKKVVGRIPLPSVTSRVTNVCNKLNQLGIKAENTVTGVWGNLKVGQSMTEAAKGKVKLKAKKITEGGYETLYKHNFTTLTNEKLLKTFACYLMTSTGAVAGTLYLSDIHVAFCSDRPLLSVNPNGSESWIYYKVQLALNKLIAVKPLMVKNEKQPQKSITLSTIDGQDFWLVGFVNHEKATKHLLKSMEAASLKSERLIQ